MLVLVKPGNGSVAMHAVHFYKTDLMKLHTNACVQFTKFVLLSVSRHRTYVLMYLCLNSFYTY